MKQAILHVLLVSGLISFIQGKGVAFKVGVFYAFVLLVWHWIGLGLP